MNKRFQCRSHPGGIFTMPARRGRPPVRCTDEHPCDKVNLAIAVANTLNASPMEQPRRALTANPSLVPAMAAKARLEAAGWGCKGHAYSTGEGPTLVRYVELTCSRDAETLVMRWGDGRLLSQHYAMEFENPVSNGYPPSSLTFDPAEVTDSELVRLIRGMKVQWWNVIGQSTETAVIGGNVTIEHIFFTNGDEDNSKRIVKFIDHGGGGFRAFHASALLKVG